ncbi:MAG TPA: FAD-dependent oxidoreductase [Acidimicrobiales bacterium]|nr:FAD-dependent oxidoreductase [Acidimicrobiales bacterium]
MTDFDVVVVGAGPAGSVAALELARAGLSTCLLERGPFPGSKNVYGGVVYPRVLDTVLPRWWERAPVQRFVTRRSTMVMTETQSVCVDVRAARWGEPPYNGVTAYRAEFDQWLADEAVAAGATLVTSTTATGLVTESGRVRGVTTDRPGSTLSCSLVVACDGVNSFLAREAGLYPSFSREHLTLGVKEVLALDRAELESRFALEGREGCDIEMIGTTGAIAGGGFLYTNLDTISIGCVLQLDDLASSGRRPEEVLAQLKAHPSVAPLVRGAELVEYAAHLIPEGGYDAMPTLGAPGIVVAGDAASMTLAAGVFLEGVNFAMGAGQAAARAAVRASGGPDGVGGAHAHYRGLLEQSFVLRDHKRLRGAPQVVLSEFIQRVQPGLVCDVAESYFTVVNPAPKRGLLGTVRATMRARGVGAWSLLKGAARVARVFR